jgi:hypothetical protein
MNVHRSLWLALPFAFLLPLGCNGGGEPGQEAEGSETAAAAAPAPAPTTAAVPVATTQGHRHGHHRGAAHMLFRAARDLDLSDAQRTTIDSLAAQLHGDRTAESSRHQAMRTALAESVRAGKVDVSALAPAETAAAGTGRQAHIARETTALNGLWAALEPAQRQALVASVQERQTERAERWASRRAEGKAAGGWGQQRLAHLTAKLGLDASQQTAVSGILTSDRPAPAVMQARHAQMKSRNAALLTAFQSDSFDATTLIGTPPSGSGVSPAQRHVQFLAQLVPILRTDQRETLATSIETRQN